MRILLLLLFAISSLSSGCATISLMEALPPDYEDVISESTYSVEQLQSNNNCYRYNNSKCLSYYLPKEITSQDDGGSYFRLEVLENHDRLGVLFKENTRTIDIQNFEIVDEYNQKFSLTANFTSDEPQDKLIKTLCIDVERKNFSPSNCGIKSIPNVRNAYSYNAMYVRIQQANDEEITNDLDEVDIRDNILVNYKFTRRKNKNYNGVFVCVLLPVTIVIDVVLWPVSVFYVYARVMGR